MCDDGVLVMELSSGLSFPAAEHLSHVLHSQALQGNHEDDFFVPSLEISVFQKHFKPRQVFYIEKIPRAHH